MKLNNYVPWEEHVKWFDNILKFEDKILLISLLDKEKIGVVRFDFKENGVYEVSINLNPLHRGKGYGQKVLESSIAFFLQLNPDVNKLYAMFKKINTASKNTFLKNGFDLIENMDKNLIGLERFDLNTEEYCEMIIKKYETRKND